LDHRVQFDFDIDFSNGGGLQGRGFRLDIAGDDISDRDLADCIVADMRLLMVGAIRIRNKQVIVEPHNRVPFDATGGRGRYVDLSHTIGDGVITHRGLPGPLICDYLSREGSRELYANGTEFQIARIEMVANTGTYVDVPSHRYANGRICRRSASSASPISTQSSCAQKSATRRRSASNFSVAGRSAIVPCWSIPAGTGTGIRRSISASIRSLPPTPRFICATAARSWSGSIR
jgi:hypothetical protein